MCLSFTTRKIGKAQGRNPKRSRKRWPVEPIGANGSAPGAARDRLYGDSALNSSWVCRKPSTNHVGVKCTVIPIGLSLISVYRVISEAAEKYAADWTRRCTIHSEPGNCVGACRWRAGDQR